MFAPLDAWEKWRRKDDSGDIAVAVQESALRPNGEQKRNASRAGLLPRIKRNIVAGLSTPDKCTGWILTALPKALSIVRKEKIDCLYTSTPPHSAHLIGLLAKKFSGRPFVADFRAPWTQNEYFDDVKIIPWQKRLEERMELAIHRSAEIVISNSTWEGDGYRRKYGPLVGEDKFYPILNGYDPDDFDPTGAVEYDKFTIVYIGSLYKRRSPEPFLEGFRKFLDAHPGAKGHTKALFIGPGDGVLRAFATQYGVSDHIESVEFLPQNEAYKYLYGAHVLLMILGFDSRGKGVIPAKIFEYLPTGRPVLALIPEGETAEMMRKYDAGTIITTPDVDQVVHGIETYYQAYQQNPKVIPRVKVIDEYTRRHQTSQFAELLDRAVEKSNARKSK
jgi:glycosyltransferase involved in cell wall biosynthesis